jgi:AAA family ATP:ADP antiporter
LAGTDSPTRTDRDGTSRLIAMAALFFIAQCAVGVLRPIKNALALDGLGGTNFYQVYLVSAVVALFVPAYTKLIERVAWRRLVPGIALFFVVNLFLMRMLYQPGSTVFGLVFYGWYDLFSAAVISQFFLAAQWLVDTRSAKRAYPMVIAGGSIGAAAGGAVTGFMAQSVGSANLLLFAALLILLFGIFLPLVGEAAPGNAANRRSSGSALSDLRAVAADPHVRLIAVMVLVTIVVKQLVDYQFNALTEAVYGTTDRMSAFQGKFNLATQWLPLVVLLALRPLLRRRGVGVAVLMLPVFMIFANLGLAVFWSLWAAIFAKATETTLRYSAERAGREILYLPVPDDLKLKAKNYIDVALEEGLGKAVAGGVIFLLLLFLDLRGIAVVAVGLSIVWLTFALRVRNQYVRTLAKSIVGRYASMRGFYGTLGDATTWPLIRRALASEDRLQVVFALELIDESPPADVRALAPDLSTLLDHPAEEIRARVLALFERFPGAADVDAVRARLADPSESVREAAVRVLVAVSGASALEALLASDRRPVRTAALKCIVRGGVAADTATIRKHYDPSTWSELPADAETRAELALAAGTLPGDADAVGIVQRLMDDGDPRVASTAMLAAATLELDGCAGKLIAALGPRETREAARNALTMLGRAAIGPLTDSLLDNRTDPSIRRVLPSILARVPTDATVAALLHAVIAPETGQVLDYRTLKALSRLRADHDELTFDPDLALSIVRREAAVGGRYARARAALGTAEADDAVITLARAALADAWTERREGAFRSLGLIYDPNEVFRCHVALRGESVERANALEWLEQTVGYSLFRELDPILSRTVDQVDVRVDIRQALAALLPDEDTWVETCIAAAARRLDLDIPQPEATASGMDLIETVFLLQGVDLLKDARSGHLALLAGIAEEVTVEKGERLIRQGEPTESLYVVTRGKVELEGVGDRITIGEGEAFGTWALIDDVPSPVEAVTAETTRMLRLRREEFHDLVADHPELAIGLLQGLARRIRSLVA